MGKVVFTNIPTNIKILVDKVRNGTIGLPDLQRPFVWNDSKVRDLFDSIMQGYPIGYIMVWKSPSNYEEKKSFIGNNKKIYQVPDELIIDGQQRLSSLVAAMYGVKVKDKNYQEREIKISFNPLTREFSAWRMSYEHDPEWISKICDVFIAKENNSYPEFRRKYISELNKSRKKKGKDELTVNECDLIETNLNQLLEVESFILPTMEIPACTDEQYVADIFVRVNSGGQKLNENNFIQTLIAVYEKDIHDRIDRFCEGSRNPQEETSYNNIIDVDPQFLVRTAIGVGFHRAKLKYVYMLLRGKNLDTEKYSDDIRIENLTKFKEALEYVMNINNWHAFLRCIEEAGYISKKMHFSTNAVAFSYILYLIGKIEYKVPSSALKRIIAKWFFMSAITSFYTGSVESTVEKQFADLRNINNSKQFVLYLEERINNQFTEEYFEVKLPRELDVSKTNSPLWNGYIASQIILGHQMLFSKSLLSQLILPGNSGSKKAIDIHHIFPKNYLSKNGYTKKRDCDQIANLTYLAYEINIEISDNAPSDYIRKYKERYGDEFNKYCKNHALPENFESMNYMDFLKERRVLMAQIIKEAYEKL